MDKRTFLITIWKTILHDIKEKEGISNILFGSFSINTPDTLSFSSLHDSLHQYIYIYIQCKFWNDTHGTDIFWQSVNFENVNCVTASDLPRGREGHEKISDMPVSRHVKRGREARTRCVCCFRNGAQCASIKKNSHPPPSQKYGR